MQPKSKNSTFLIRAESKTCILLLCRKKSRWPPPSGCFAMLLTGCTQACLGAAMSGRPQPHVGMEYAAAGEPHSCPLRATAASRQVWVHGRGERPAKKQTNKQQKKTI